jgi:membrane protein implicated in regulation of membrane protease activity
MISSLWAILAVILFVAQFASGVFDLLFVAIAALLVAAASAIIPGFGDAIWLQVLSWVVTSFAGVYVFRKRFRHLFRGEEIKQEKSQHAGLKATVIEVIGPGRAGRIKFQGTTWSATSIDEEIAAGAEVYILELEGMNYVVTSRLLDEETIEGPAPGNRLEEPGKGEGDKRL